MINRKWIGYFALLLSFIAGQSTYFHSHNNHEDHHSSVHFNPSSDNNDSIDENCSICDFNYQPYSDTKQYHTNFSIGLFYSNKSIVRVTKTPSKSQTLLTNKAPPISC